MAFVPDPFRSFRFDGGGDLNQARDHNDLNEIEDGDDQDSEAIVETSGQSAWVDPEYDARGNMTVAPAAPYEEQVGEDILVKYKEYLFTYDCFNRVTGVYDDQDAQVAAYTYDAANRRVTKTVTGYSYHYQLSAIRGHHTYFIDIA